MNIIEIYKTFPTQQDCINHLEKVRWNNEPVCPYCNSKNNTQIKKENRYHCNTCNTSFSVMINTIFENTKLDFQKWFLAISLVLNAKKGISARQLARDIEVNKNTAWYMLMRLRTAMIEQTQLLEGIVEIDETYIGGKDSNRHQNNKKSTGSGMDDKTPVFGMLQRDNKIVAHKVKKANGKVLKPIIRANISKDATIVTDGFGAYNNLNREYNHEVINHAGGEYTRGIYHTNSIENFWSLLKRGIVGQYHYVTDRYLDKYITEFSFRQNNRKNDKIFELVLEMAVNQYGLNKK
jgi:transposase-like protein